MHHKATISEREGRPKPFHMECTCGVQGDFASDAEARFWIENVHFRHYAGVGICTCELVPSAPTPASAPPPAAQEAGAEVESKKNEDSASFQDETVRETVGDA